MSVTIRHSARTAILLVPLLCVCLSSCSDRPASIEGTILLPGADDHEGTRVFLPGSPYQAITDRTGRFFFPNVETGDYELVADREGYEEYRKTGLHIRPGAEIDLIPVELNPETRPEKGGALEGQVALSTGESPLGALLLLENASLIVNVAGDGSFSIPGLEPGDYSLVAVKPGYVAVRKTAAVIAGATTSLDRMILSPATTAASAPDEGRITGRVVLLDSRSRAGVTVAVEGTSLMATTDADGLFSIEEVRAGTYTVRYRKEGYFPVRDVDVSVESAAETRLEATLRPIPEAAAFNGLARVEDAGSIRGFIGTLQGEGVEGAEVTLEPLGASAVTDRDGGYVFPVVPEGVYSVKIDLEGFRPGSLTGLRVGAGQETFAPELILEPVPESEIPPKAVTVGGTVFLEGEEQHLGVVVALLDTRFTALTGPDGSFEFRDILPGEYILLAAKDGFEPAEVPVDVPEGSGVTLRPFTLERVVIPPGIVDTVPADGQRGVSVGDFVQIIIQFDQRMNGPSLKKAFRISPEVDHELFFGGEEGTVPFTALLPYLHLDFSTQAAVRNEAPPSGFDRLVVRLLRYGSPPVRLDRSYTVTMTTEAQNIEGVGMEEPYEFSFSTGGGRIVGTWPQDGQTGVFILENDALIFDFNTRIDRSSFEKAFRMRPKGTTVPIFLPERVPSGDRVKVQVFLQEETDYTIEIGSAARTMQGDRLDNTPYTIHFRTASIEDIGEDYDFLFEDDFDRGSNLVERHRLRREERKRRYEEGRAVRQSESPGD